MTPNFIKSDNKAGNHYAVGVSHPFNTEVCKWEGGVLLQVAEKFDVTRILLNVDETHHLISLLEDSLDEYKKKL